MQEIAKILPNIIETINLKKTFSGKGKGKNAPVEAVRGISFEVKAGEIFGLLGPNGAGKTTTMRMLCTLLEPSGGKTIVAGYDLYGNQDGIRKKIGYVSQVGGMQREGTGKENLMLQARLYGMKKNEAKSRVAELLDLLMLREFADKKNGTYSGGQRRILELSSGIVHMTELLFLN